MAKTTTSRKAAGLSELFLGIGCILLVLFIGSFTRVRVDLTSEKRYTLTPATEDLMDSLKDVVFVKVYLSGDLPADLRQLSRSTRELLDEMRVRNPDLLQYEFVDPNANPDEELRLGVYRELTQQGLHYSSIRTRDKGAQSELIVWPGAIITYRGKNLPVQLLKTQFRTADAEMVNRSINNLEYELTSGIRQITQVYRPRIAFLEGQGELDELAVKDITKALEEQYSVDRVRIDGRLDALSIRPDGAKYRTNNYEALIIAKPDSAFTMKDKYILDQFVMDGGRILWVVDPMDPHLDSLRLKQFSIATPYDLGIDDLLFAYGVRMNKDLLLDKQCAPIQITTTPYGNQPKIESLPFPFEPIVIPRSTHPVVNNIDPLHLKFTSSIDTVALDSATCTVLLTSSPYTRALKNPVRISLSVVDMDLKLDRNNTPDRPVAVLTEGIFRSAFADKLAMPDSVTKAMGFRRTSRRTAQLFVSDGDAIENHVDRAKNTYYMLGYDRYAGTKVYGNREFFVNAMDYLLNENSLITIRSRSISLRQLDAQRIERDRTTLQAANVAAPILLSIIAGMAFLLLRRRRYAHAA